MNVRSHRVVIVPDLQCAECGDLMLNARTDPFPLAAGQQFIPVMCGKCHVTVAVPITVLDCAVVGDA